MKRVILLAVGLLSVFAAAYAVPAKRGFYRYVQPDGSIVAARLVGDESGHYYVSEDGCPMLMDSLGTMCHAAIVNGRLTAGAPVRRSGGSRAATERISSDDFARAFSAAVREKRIHPAVAGADARGGDGVPQNGLGLVTGNYPRSGKVRSLVFLVEYRDLEFNTPDPEQYFDRLFNEVGFSENGGTGSVRDYFLQQSGGAFDIHYDIYGPVKLANNRSYYGGNSGTGGSDVRPREMVMEAAEALKDKVDFSQYDFDNDGWIDNIFVVYAGEGEASGGPAESVWPHSWVVTGTHIYNGKRLYGYCCTNEWNTNGKPAPIGTFVHEFSHVMGLPDLYNTEDSGVSYTPGEWSVLDYGPYNNEGNTPPSFGAFERNAMGWLVPRTIRTSGDYRLEDIQKSNDCILIPSSGDNEFFLLENRQQTGWDTYLPGHGMLVWHVDFNQNIWDRNVVNNNEFHNYVDIIEACGTADNYDPSVMGGYPFPGTSSVTDLSAETDPGLKVWRGNPVDAVLYDIDEVDGVVTFYVERDFRYVTPEALDGEAASASDITLRWEKLEYAARYYLTVGYEEAGTVVPFAGYDGLDVGNVTEYHLSLDTDRSSIVFYVAGEDRSKNRSQNSNIATVTIGSSGIMDIEAGSSEPAEYFTPQGISVSDPGPGIYIRRTGSKIEKVVITK